MVVAKTKKIRLIQSGLKTQMIRFYRLTVFLSSGLLLTACSRSEAPAPETPPTVEFKVEAGTYQNIRVTDVPWSIHVVRVPRQTGAYEIYSQHADGLGVGLATLSDQIEELDEALGIPLAGINGDFYERSGPYAGHPRGLQIMNGELISAPTGGASFWVDAQGGFNATNVVSELQVTWPNGLTGPVGLNGGRQYDELELYTPAIGRSTRTGGGREYVLERQGAGPWLPLRPGQTYKARVQQVRDTGNAPLTPDTMVLSVGGRLRAAPPLAVGAELRISTGTLPSLTGARAAISGGPILVRGGKPLRIRGSWSDSYNASSMFERHPRSAIGWNEEYFFMVEVDGRQRNLSIGMTLEELANFMISIGCRDAMNLDGGGSATLWHGGKTRNRPCDMRERAIANSVVVLKKHGKAAAAPAGAAKLRPEQTQP
jgi:hypothetical protein